MRSLGKATAAIPVLRRGFAQTLRVGSKNFTEHSDAPDSARTSAPAGRNNGLSATTAMPSGRMISKHNAL